MRDLKYVLKQSYEASRALVIGINDYKNASPLGYAVSDAEEIKQILIDEIGFDADNVISLLDSEATEPISEPIGTHTLSLTPAKPKA